MGEDVEKAPTFSTLRRSRWIYNAIITLDASPLLMDLTTTLDSITKLFKTNRRSWTRQRAIEDDHDERRTTAMPSKAAVDSPPPAPMREDIRGADIRGADIPRRFLPHRVSTALDGPTPSGRHFKASSTLRMRENVYKCQLKPLTLQSLRMTLASARTSKNWGNSTSSTHHRKRRRRRRRRRKESSTSPTHQQRR